jgi:hypothetical protein
MKLACVLLLDLFKLYSNLLSGQYILGIFLGQVNKSVLKPTI